MESPAPVPSKEHDGVSTKDAHSSSKDGHRSSSDKHKSSSSSSSSSKPKIKSSSSSSSSSSKPKEGSSSSSKPKDGKPTSNGERAKDGKSSSGDKHKSNNHSISNNSSSSKPSSNSVKPKEGSAPSKSGHSSSSSSHHHKSSSSSSSSKPKDGSGDKKSSSSSSSSSKPKEGSSSNSIGSPPPSSNSLKPKSSSGDHHKSSSSSSSSKPKESSSSKDGATKTSSSSGGSSSKPSGSSSSRPLDKKPSSSSSSTEKKSSSSSAPKVKDENRNKENHESHSSHKDKSKDSGISKLKDGSDDKTRTEVKIKSDAKDRDHGSGSKSKTNSSSSSTKIKTEPNGKVSSHDLSNNLKLKPEPMSDEEIPLADKKLNSSSSIKKEIKVEKRPAYDEDSEDEPLFSKLAKKPKKEDKRAGQTKRKSYAESSDEDEPVSKKMKKAAKTKAEAKGAKFTTAQPTASPVKKGKKAAAEEPEVWKWWEEEKKSDGSKWKSLEHKGPVFAPDYEPLPKSVKFYYNGKHVELSQDAEEIATFYARMLDHDYTSKDAFNNNFLKDWRKSMTSEERDLITDLSKCDFKKMHSYFLQKTEERKSMTKEQKQVIKKQNDDMLKEYGFCIIDGHKEKIGNFKIEPPGLFRGRGEHPKMGKLKKRTMPEDVIINCSKGSKVPDPPKGHKWKEVRHDNMVSWLASWTENVQNQTKYVMLNPSSKLKGEKDWQKYETARKLKGKVGKIRQEYQEDWRSKEMRLRQRAVALYFIDKLALRAGNEKDSDETADTVGCCSLRVEHIVLHEKKDGKEYVVDFDFLGKDSIRYFNSVAVEKRVFKNLQLFMQNKQPQDDLFDRLNTTILNKYLNDLMEGLTAKVFRTYNASKTLQDQLAELTNPKDSVAAKLLSYNRANRAVAILCNHQRAVPKTFGKSMENMNSKITAKKDQIKEAKKDLKDAKGNRSVHEKKSKALERLKEQLDKLEMQATDKEENKQISLGTSKLNYLDPRISVAWCKKWEIPIEKIFNRTHRDKFRWAIDMAGPDYVF